MNLSRRRALFGFLAAPAIVAAPSLMRVSSAAVVAPEPVWTPYGGQFFGSHLLENKEGLAALVRESNALLAKLLETRRAIDRVPPSWWRNVQ